MVGRVCLALLAFFVSAVSWAFPASSGFHYRDPSYQVVADNISAACDYAFSQHSNNPYGIVYRFSHSTESSDYAYCYFTDSRDGFVTLTSFMFYKTRALFCPSFSSLVGSDCVCDAGYVESGGQCVSPKDPVCGGLADMPMGVGSIESDFGKQSAGWAASKIGQSGSACVSGCKVSGTVSGCVLGGSAVCMIASPVFTGDACTPEEEQGPSEEGCPDGTVLQPVSGLCVPQETSCPAGEEPSKYVEGVCIPVEDLNDGLCEDPSDPSKRVECVGKESKCPSGKVPSKLVPGACVVSEEGAELSQNGNIYICKNGVCTVIAGDCDPSQGSCVTEKTKGDSCKEAPDLKQCTQDSGITGSCGGSFQCKGDSVQCAIAVEQHKRNCELFDKSDPFKLVFENAVKSQNEDGVLSGTEVDLSGHLNVDSVIGNGQCPSDLIVTVFGQDIPVKLSEFCQYFNAMGYLIFLGACVSCLRILVT